MAAYFKTPLKEITIYAGTSQGVDPTAITEVQLDGDELEYVRRTMTGIPMHLTKRVQRWFGDDAKFIAANW
jgi:hypothetical protein